jgi:preprotein translocase subunit YajC
MNPFLILADAASPGAKPFDPSGLIMIVCMSVIFYFLIIRPQSKRQKEQETLIKSLKTGDKVITGGGIHGLISNVKETTVIVKIADNVKIEVDKAAITSVAKESAAKS